MAEQHSASPLIFFVNGKKVTVNKPCPETTLIQYLRNNFISRRYPLVAVRTYADFLGAASPEHYAADTEHSIPLSHIILTLSTPVLPLSIIAESQAGGEKTTNFLVLVYLTGTKRVCGQGACGACTVMLSSFDWKTKKIHHISVNACLLPLCYLHGMAVTTVEGVGSTKNGLHPIQKCLVESHGLQCGFCTPGMVMTMYTLFRNNPKPTQEQMERVLEGNLCRCTGYRPIVDAFKVAKEKCPCGMGLCLGQYSDNQERKEENENTEQKLNENFYNRNIKFCDDKYTWFRPTNLKDLLLLKSKYPKAPLVMGCNSIGYLMRKGELKTQTIICGTSVPELTEVEITDNGVKVGAGITFEKLERALDDISKTVQDPKNRTLEAVLKVLRWIGVDQIRNTATIGGHIMSEAPNLDLQTLLMAAGAKLYFLSKDVGPVFSNKTGKECNIDNSFFKNGYGRIGTSEILVYITIPFATKREYIYGIKQPNRRGFDYGIVTSGFYVCFQDDKNIVKEMRLSFGGLGSTPMLAEQARRSSIKTEWNDKLVPAVCDAIIKELKTGKLTDIKFRLALACSFFFRFHQQVKYQLQKEAVTDTSFTDGLALSMTSGLQLYDVPDVDGKTVVWKPIPNVTSEYITAGEALYIDDIPRYQNELFAALVTSAHAHAKIVDINVEKALQVEGVVDFLCHKDVPCHNRYGMHVQDSYLFAEDEVLYYGQVVGVILADNREIAEKAAKLVDVKYEILDAIITIQDAIEKDSFLTFKHNVIRGDIAKAKEEAKFMVEGEIETGSQEHMYFETQSALVIPKKEQKEVEVYVASQTLNEVQQELAKFIGIPHNRITVKVKRVGGGFGGKLTNSIMPSGIALIGAWKHGRPVRCIFDRESDIKATGKRHPSKAFYKVYVSSDGKLLGLDMDFYLNAGYSTDLSLLVGSIGAFFLHGGYHIPNLSVRVKLCKTNTTSNTAMRGLGSPQYVFTIEHIVQHAAQHIKMPAIQMKQLNLLRNGDTTPFKKSMTDDNLHRCFEECLALSQYEDRCKEVEKFNSENRWKKRGIAVTPIIFGMGFAPLVMNQAGALLLVYLDGSVLLSHGGVELGQGINTKIIQVAATALGIPLDKIIISEASTSTVPNTIETGGSQACDLNAGAVLDACSKLNERLEPIKKMKPEGSWEDWVQMAWFNRVSLSVTGYFKPRENGYDFEKNEGDHCNYFTFGTACSETEIDCLTGEHQVRRTDIVMDIGKSLNPAIDIGQIEGGFVQGYGMMTMEKIAYSSDGRMHNTGPLDYKIPCVRNIPREFKVKLLKDSEGGKAVYSSKATGEPPLLLAVSVHLSLKEAIMAARRETGHFDNYMLKCPATAETIRMACQDEILDKCEKMEL